MSQPPPAARDHSASQLLRLDPSVVAELADLLSDMLVERLREAIRADVLADLPSEAQDWLDAQDVADRLHMSREWVYEHAEELGVLRIGGGPRPRLRFPPRILDVRDVKPPSRDVPAQSRAPRAKPTGLIPIRGS
jgi:hypothetical protein